ncbi:MAG: radical SAM protein [Candidatus Omnitrophica bacterium]|nr:radical SAM protein [Candidatus Omnitrophota bacterium]
MNKPKERSYQRGALSAIASDKESIFKENKRKNTKEISEKKIILDSMPLWLGINVTDWCNLQCIMCPSIRHNKKVTLSESALVKIKELLPYLERIDWQGGEFFGFPHIKKIFEFLIGYPAMHVEITTNGLLLDQEWIELLLELNSRVSFSIDSTDQKIYEYIRRGARFDILLSNLKKIQEIEIKTGKNLARDIFVVVMKSNMHTLPSFIDFAAEFGFRAVTFQPVQFITNEENIFYNNSYDVGFLQKVMAEVTEAALLKNIILRCNLPCCSKKTDSVHYSLQGFDDSLGLFCLYPWKALWIKSEHNNGDIFPECWCKENVGNIDQDSLLQAWNSIKMQQYRKRIIDKDRTLCNKNCLELREGKIFCKHL